MLRGAVSKPLQLTAKQSQLGGFSLSLSHRNAVSKSQPTAECAPASLPLDDVHHHVEHLSAAHLQSFLKASRLQSLDLDQAITNYKKSRYMDIPTPSQDGAMDSCLSKDSLSLLDGNYLDALFNVTEKSMPLVSCNLDQLRNLLFASQFNGSSIEEDTSASEVPQKKVQHTKVCKPDGCINYCSSGGADRPTDESDKDLPNADLLNTVHDYFVEVVSGKPQFHSYLN
jgi:hypothetical protein